jgi:uncharacterized membrane protein
MSLLAAFALLAAQGGGLDGYRAVGAAPFWQVSINNGFVMFETPGLDAMSLGPTTPEITRRGFTYRSDGDVLNMTVRHGDCVDSLTRRTFADHVTMQVGTRFYRGCGGALRGRPLRTLYEASGAEPFWSLEIANGRLYFGANMEVRIVPEPRPVVSRDGRTRRYRAPGINVALRRQNCLFEDGRTYADTVTVIAGDWRVEGCGGRVLREAADE